MTGSERPTVILPEARQVEAGSCLALCTCGRSARLPDCEPDCGAGLALQIQRQQTLLLCRCGLSRRLPYCDSSHQPAAPGLKSKWRRFLGRD